MVAQRGVLPTDLRASRRTRHHLLGHRKRLPARQLRGVRRPRDQETHATRRRRPGHQSLGKMHNGPGGQRLSRAAIMEQIDASRRCSPCAWTRASAPSPTHRKGKAASPDPGASRPSGPAKTPSPRPSTWTSTSRSSTRCRRSPKRAGSRWPRSRWRGFCPSRSFQAPIVGATKPHHLADAVAALDLTLTDEEIARLEQPYTTQAPYWF